ncbi:hypothetical protein AVEN_248572-1, partial [Araneus ventricosus]
ISWKSAAKPLSNPIVQKLQSVGFDRRKTGGKEKFCGMDRHSKENRKGREDLRVGDDE